MGPDWFHDLYLLVIDLPEAGVTVWITPVAGIWVYERRRRTGGAGQAHRTSVNVCICQLHRR
jgi:hypothetical protein